MKAARSLIYSYPPECSQVALKLNVVASLAHAQPLYSRVLRPIDVRRSLQGCLPEVPFVRMTATEKGSLSGSCFITLHVLHVCIEITPGMIHWLLMLRSSRVQQQNACVILSFCRPGPSLNSTTLQLLAPPKGRRAVNISKTLLERPSLRSTCVR